MTPSALERLVDIGGPALSPAGRATASRYVEDLLRLRNGFFAMEGALFVRPASSYDGHIGIAEWNEPALWRSAYGSIEDRWVFFAEDVFGGQFGICADGVSAFDPETGEPTAIAADLEGWAGAVLDDHELLTGWPLARAWQAANGPLAAGHRLVPRVPFVLGGAFDISNLYAAETVRSLRYRAEIANQIADLPDGEAVRIRIVE